MTPIRAVGWSVFRLEEALDIVLEVERENTAYEVILTSIPLREPQDPPSELTPAKMRCARRI